MLQLPGPELVIAPGRAVEWRVHTVTGGTPAPGRTPSHNQEYHFVACAPPPGQAEDPDGRPGPRTDSFAVTFEIDGRLDEPALEAALLHCVRRHEVLRCDFRPSAAGGLDIEVAEPADVKLERIDRGTTASTAEARAYAERFLRSTDTRRGPWFVMGATVRRDSATVHLVCDHLVTDGTSLMVLVHDVATAYEAFAAGRQPQLPLPGGFLDHGRAERERAAAARPDDAALAPWRGFIARNGGPFPKFPLDLGIEPGAGAPAVNSTDPLLDRAGAAALEARLRTLGAGVPAGVLAALGVSLRAEGGPDVHRALVPVSTRGRGRHAHGAGWFVNLVPVEFPVPEGAELAPTVAGVRDASTRMVRAGRIPFVVMLRLLAPEHYARPWPHAVNFSSYMDYRAVPGAARHAARRVAGYTSVPATNGMFLWVFRSDAGIHLNCVHVDTREARRVKAALIGTLSRTLENMARHGTF
ncbi:condensation domain-containing protein [Streptomyces sp. NPDC089919]|uniref:condensation domain-containing protein n=1 Tax=Streptomyces sp. NPDC089919 TaxID=3155188 RepID=UPI0034394DAF